MDTSIVGKVAVAQFNPKRVGALGDKFTRVQVGTFIGRATDLIVRTLPDTTVVEGLKGDFELSRIKFGLVDDVLVANGEIEAVYRSGVAYLPPGVDEMIKGPLTARNADGKRANESVAFAFDVYLTKAANPAGYSWEFVPAVQVQTNDDPLTALRNQIAEKKQAAIADQSAAAPAKAAKK